jgi:lysozyme family protein
MSKFDKAVEQVLKWEGGYVKDVSDPGGCTNFGISLRFLRTLNDDVLKKYGIFENVNCDTIKNLTVDQARRIYFEQFWEGHHFDSIDSHNLCGYTFDLCVNIGTNRGIALLQRAILAAKFERHFIQCDGFLNDKTIAIVNEIGEMLLPILVAIRAEYYSALAKQANFGKFLDGWLNRTYGFFDR